MSAANRSKPEPLLLWLKVTDVACYIFYKESEQAENTEQSKQSEPKFISYLTRVANKNGIIVLTRREAENRDFCRVGEDLSKQGFLEFTAIEHTFESLEKHIANLPDDFKENFDENESARREMVNAEHNHVTDTNIALVPILHWSVCDVFDLENTPLKEVAKVPRYVKYFDSSIWHYYYPFFRWQACQKQWSEDDGEERLLWIFREMYRNACRNLYSLTNASEFRELNKRLMKEAFLAGSAHGQAVSPFVFHSEFEVKARIEKEKRDFDAGNKCRTDLFGGTKWRILLVDDHANKFLKETERKKLLELPSPYGDCQAVDWDEEKMRTRMCPMGKLRIIYDLLLSVKKDCRIIWSSPSKNDVSKIAQHLSAANSKLAAPLEWNYVGETDCEKGNFDIAIVCAHDVESALTLLSYARFDIVLLDYLLGSRKNGREYSYTLLKKIKHRWEQEESREDKPEEEKDDKQKNFPPTLFGPNGKLFFMHISAFVPAIAERLQEQMLVRDTKYWHIARGACPINTPQLFLFYFFSLMEKRYSELNGNKEPAGESSVSTQTSTLVGLLYAIFGPDGAAGRAGFISVKNNAVKRFNELLGLRRRYDILRRNDVVREDPARDWCHRKGSLLVYSLFPDIECYSNSCWEHVQHLIYLIAFGTVRQWPEMWEEYLFVRERLQAAERIMEDRIRHYPFFDGEMLTDKIEKYIVGLKNA